MNPAEALKSIECLGGAAGVVAIGIIGAAIRYLLIRRKNQSGPPGPFPIHRGLESLLPKRPKDFHGGEHH
jgi:hypothetical protein